MDSRSGPRPRLVRRTVQRVGRPWRPRGRHIAPGIGTIQTMARDTRREQLARYGFAIATVIGAVTIRVALTPVLHDRAQYVILALAVAMTAWFAGFGPAVVAALLGVVAALTVLVPPLEVLTPPTVADVGATLLYLAVAAGVIALADRAQRRGHAVEEQNRELRRLLEQNRALLALRDGFSGMLSHELRTPLTVILGDSRLLSRRMRERDDADGASLAEDVEHEAERLHLLIEDLLVVSRGDATLHVDTEPVLLRQVVGDAVAVARRRHPRLVVEAKLPASTPAVAADQTLLGQVLVNLLSNAARYAGDEATVTIRAREESDLVVIEIEDDGPGFPPGALERCFDAFYRAPETAGQASGSGIGLYVVRRLIEAMGGEVAASNGAHGGAVLTVRIPTVVDDGEAAPAGAARLARPMPTGME